MKGAVLLAAAAEIRAVPPELRCIGRNLEFELLLACCGKGDRESRLGQLMSPQLDWGRLLSLAERQRVFPALFGLLQQRPEVPCSIQSALQARFQTHARRALRFSAELTAILEKFEDRGIHVLAHKGPALAELLFGDPVMRQFGDLDFLIRAADIPRARAALQELGYGPNLHLSARQERAYLQSGYEYVFGCENGEHLLELQWQVLPRFYSVGFAMDPMFSRSVEIEFEGRPMCMLGNDDLMLVLCVHAAKHEWAQLSMIRDISTLARFDLDWEWIEAESRRLGILRILMVSLLLARRLLGLEVPKICCSSSEMRKCEQLAADFQRKLERCEESFPESAQYFLNMMQLREHKRDRMRFLWRLAATPSVGEWKSLEIPDRYFPLYRAVRILRLLRRVVARPALIA